MAVKTTTYEIPENVNKDNWQEEHLKGLHNDFSEYFAWCPLCMAKQDGEMRKQGFGGGDLSVSISEDLSVHDVGPGQN